MSKLLIDFSKLLDGFVKIDAWISLICHMDLSKLIHRFLYVFHGFVKNDKWISLSCYMDLSKLKQGFVKVATWTDQTCFSPFPKKAEF